LNRSEVPIQLPMVNPDRSMTLVGKPPWVLAPHLASPQPVPNRTGKSHAFHRTEGPGHRSNGLGRTGEGSRPREGRVARSSPSGETGYFGEGAS
jgi:hypothetical protein